MIIRTISESPLTVTVDGVETAIQTYNYIESGNNYTCKYITVSGENIPIVYRHNFDPSQLP